MDAFDKAIAESLRRQRAGLAPAQFERKTPIVAAHASEAVDPFSPEAVLRAANEDDDLYDPYSDYMDMLSASEYDELEEDPWR